jgi:hypothetical protein
MAKRRIETSIEINAPLERVWSILTDFPGMASWNPINKSISGELKPGGRLAVRICPPGRREMNLHPTVVALHPQRELRWAGHLLVPGIFDGEHSFLLMPTGNGVRFVHSEQFSGILVGPMRSIFAPTEAGFNAMNIALKERAERHIGSDVQPI